jgi:L-lactate dehydrogenase complex protein LldG
MEEREFLARVARRLGREEVATEPAPREAVGAPAFWQGHDLEPAERLQTFCAELAQLGGEARVYDSLADLHAGLRDLLAILRPTRIGTWGGDTLAEFQLTEALDGFEVLRWGESTVVDWAQVDVGITGCAYAIADTGTLVMMADAQRGRSVHLLPTVHIALLHARQVRTQLGEVLAELSGTGIPSSVHFVTGPSRSSDIENDLSIGVHGPAAVYALVLRDGLGDTINTPANA